MSRKIKPKTDLIHASLHIGIQSLKRSGKATKHEPEEISVTVPRTVSRARARRLPHDFMMESAARICFSYHTPQHYILVLLRNVANQIVIEDK